MYVISSKGTNDSQTRQKTLLLMLSFEANRNAEPMIILDPENTMAAMKDPLCACSSAPAIGPLVKDL